MTSIDPIELQAALEAQNRAVALHLFDPGVTLIDVGQRIVEKEGRRITPKLTVRVHRLYKPTGLAFEAFKERYPERVVREEEIGFPVDIIEADYRLQWYYYPRSQPPPRGQVHDPLRGGISISTEWSVGYGTLGGLVRDRATGKPRLLSNWHVLAETVYAPEGLRILQPAVGDGGWLQHTVATLGPHAMDEGIDAALAIPTEERELANDIFELGPVPGVAPPLPGMRVTKSGRRTQVTDGIVTGIGGLQRIDYGEFDHIIRHIVHIAQTPEGGEVSAPGDSGSWWLEESTNRAIGLHFAGANEPEYGLAIAMPQVLDALNVDIFT